MCERMYVYVCVGVECVGVGGVCRGKQVIVRVNELSAAIPLLGISHWASLGHERHLCPGCRNHFDGHPSE